VSKPNFCQGSWQLTRCSSASASALNFVSSPPMMKRSCLGSLLVMRIGYTVTTLRQSDNHPSGKAPRHQGPKKARRVKSNLKSMLVTFFDNNGIVHKEFISRGQTVNSEFYCEVFAKTAWKSAKTSSPTLARTDLAASPWQRTGSHCRPHPTVFGCKQNSCYPPPTVLPWFGTPWLLLIS